VIKKDLEKSERVRKQRGVNYGRLLDWYQKNESGNVRYRLERDCFAYWYLLENGSDGLFESLSGVEGVTKRQARRHVKTDEKNAKRYQECLQDLGLQV